MIPELGHIALILAFLVAVLQATIPLIGVQSRRLRFILFADRAAFLQFLLLALSFALLTYSFVVSDFSLRLTATHSHTAKPLIYKISGVWGNHEGSMMLWCLILAAFGALMARHGKALPFTLKARALSVQGLMGAGFLGFLLFTSNPFLRLNPIPLNGQGLNPVLQDPGLALHPPFLYLGYVGFSVAFALSVAALMEGRVDAIWARWLRPWVLLAWSFLTIGITMGSVWAYYELGWGGWWMWDPVENVSFMPWLAGTALLHSVMALGQRHIMASWTVLLGITTFSLSLIGTFVVRSGVLVSVHAFAVDPARGVVILALLLFFTGGALTLYALRAQTLRAEGKLAAVSREGGLLINNLLLVAACATVFLGTFYPLLIDAVTGDKISVGKPYFDIVFTPIMLLLILFMAVGPLVRWRQDNLQRLKPFLIKSALGAGLMGVALFVLGKTVWGALGLAFALYLGIGVSARLGEKIRWGQVNPSESWRLLRQQPAATYGFLLGHFGMVVFVIGVTVLSVWSSENSARLRMGETLAAGSYAFTLDRVEPGTRENYQYLLADISVKRHDEVIVTLQPERRFYPVRGMMTTEAGFYLRAGPTLFAAIGEGDPEQGWIVRAYHHPFVIWIWIGALMMALAGFVSLLDRRIWAGRVS